MYTYIKQSLPKHYATFEQPLSSEEYDNLGENWQDYLDNKFVLLNEQQATFIENNPEASMDEVWNMELHVEAPAPERTLEVAKEQKIKLINEYDAGNSVNGFDVQFSNGAIVSLWLTPAERANYKNSIDSAKLIGLSEVSLYIGNNPITLPVLSAETMLAQIQLYADQCYVVTKQHIASVESLDTIEDVDDYDYSVGYPSRLIFTL